MKRALRLILLLTLVCAAEKASAQDVFNIVFRTAEEVVNSDNSSDFDIKVNQFKMTTLKYYLSTGVKKNGSVMSDEMDLMAYSLNVFLTKYLSDIRKTKDEARKECVMKYIKITRACPMYEDPDKEMTESFVSDPGGFTPFSINVNWIKALEELEKADKKK